MATKTETKSHSSQAETLRKMGETLFYPLNVRSFLRAVWPEVNVSTRRPILIDGFDLTLFLMGEFPDLGSQVLRPLSLAIEEGKTALAQELIRKAEKELKTSYVASKAKRCEKVEIFFSKKGLNYCVSSQAFGLVFLGGSSDPEYPYICDIPGVPKYLNPKNIVL